MKLFNAIAAAAVIGGSLVGTQAHARGNCGHYAGTDFCHLYQGNGQYQVVIDNKFEGTGFTASFDCENGGMYVRNNDGYSRADIQVLMNKFCS